MNAIRKYSPGASAALAVFESVRTAMIPERIFSHRIGTASADQITSSSDLIPMETVQSDATFI